VGVVPGPGGLGPLASRSFFLVLDVFLKPLLLERARACLFVYVFDSVRRHFFLLVFLQAFCGCAQPLSGCTSQHFVFMINKGRFCF
jgi:hypothetical protein